MTPVTTHAGTSAMLDQVHMSGSLAIHTTASMLPLVALMETIVDSFTDLSHWTPQHGSVATVSGGQATFPCVNTYTVYAYPTVKNLAGSHFFVKLLAPDAGDGSRQSGIYIGDTQDDNENGFMFRVEGSTLNGGKFEGGVPGTNGTWTGAVSVAYNATTMAYLQIRESGGTVYFETSPSGLAGTWTTQGTVTYGFSIAGLYATLQSGYWGTNTAANAIFSNVNTTTGGGGGGGGGGGSVLPVSGQAVGALRFNETFATLNSSIWSKSWFNGGVQNGAATIAANVTTSGNACHLAGSSSGGSSINTNPNDGGKTGFTQTLGYFEIVANFVRDGFNAVWNTGQNWPGDGEDDIAEQYAGGVGVLTNNYHQTSAGSPPGYGNNDPVNHTGYSPGIHAFAEKRASGRNTTYYDTSQVRTYTTSDGGAPHYIVCNVGNGASIGECLTVYTVRVWDLA